MRVSRDEKLQTIEGFGFFGARDAWWSAPAELVDPDWARLVIGDLGLSMWRNEYYPPADRNGTSDAGWIKQRPVARAARSGCGERRALQGGAHGVIATGQHEVRLRSRQGARGPAAPGRHARRRCGVSEPAPALRRMADPQVLAAAFTHERIGNFVSVLINGARTDKTVRLVADGVPAQLDAYVTSASTPLGTSRCASSATRSSCPRAAS